MIGCITESTGNTADYSFRDDRGSVRPTEIIRSLELSKRLGVDLILASELGQWTGSFKFRGAIKLVSRIPHQHIITASSGNFGKALAYACRLVGKSCTVVMPHNAARIKVEAISAYGAHIESIETAQTSRFARVRELASENPKAYVGSSYDDPYVIEGIASLGRELAILPLDIVIAPIGGGGLASGIICGLRECGSSAEVFGAEPLLANDAARSFRARKLLANESEALTIADGARPLSLGQSNWEILKDGLSDIIEVSEDHIREAFWLLVHLAGLRAEPTGVLSIAAVLAAPVRFQGKKVCCIISGGNADPELFAELGYT